MRPRFRSMLAGFMTAAALASCTNASSSSVNDASATAATAAPAKAATVGLLPVYPGAVESPLDKDVPPPRGAKAFVTNDSVGKVLAWYKAHLRSAKVTGVTDRSGHLSIGQPPFGWSLILLTKEGQTYLLMGPSMELP